MPNAILALFPTADRLMEATDVDLERAVLLRVVELCADPMRRWVTRDVLNNEFFERGGLSSSTGRRQRD